VFVVAAGWRLWGITIWPIAYDDMLQYENTLTARRLFMHWRAIPLPVAEATWREANAAARTKAPPLMESLLAALWLLGGRERPWMGGLLTSGFWLIAGGLVYRTCVRLLHDRLGPLVGVAWFLITPFGILISRVFQHEAVFLAGIAWALHRLLEPGTLTSWRRTVLNGTLAGFGLLLKPGLGLPLVVGAALGQALSPRYRSRGALRQVAVFLLLSALPSLVYAVTYLRGETHQLIPSLLLSRMMYAGWASQIGRVSGWGPFLAGFCGSWVLWHRTGSLFGVGLFAGYVAQSLLFTWATATHVYYHLPVFFAVALGLSALGSYLAEESGRRGLGSLVRGGAVAIVTVYAAFRPLPLLPTLTDRSGEQRASTLAAVGRELGVGTRVLGLDRGYGYPLTCQWLTVQYWPSSADLGYERLRMGRVLRRNDRLEQAIQSFGPSFFVIADAEEWRRQPGLEALLRERYPLVREDPARGVWIFDLRIRRD
jgi:hypothetical protein